MAVTYDLLRTADPARWRDTGTAWQALGRDTGARADELGSYAARLRDVWQGRAAEAATAHLTALGHALRLAQLAWWTADQALTECAYGIARAHTLLRAAITAAPGVAVHGTVGAGPGADRARELLHTALRIAARTDTEAAARLHEVAASLGGVDAGATTAPALPACGLPAAQVHSWWVGLTPAQRRWLLATAPAVVGGLDGVPAADRDLANRLLLDGEREAVRRRLASAVGTERRRLLRLDAALAALAERLDGGLPRVYLLRLHTAGDGRVVLAVGDPDRSDNVLTHVPGMTADLGSFDGELHRATQVSARAAQLAPETSTSAVLWLDYDAPDFLDEAASKHPAQVGAEVLRRFQDGLRATHDGPPAHQVLLGHSYGSLVVGMAATRPGLAADDVVFVGSPGVGVGSAARLSVPAPHVWSTTSAGDVIQYAAVAPRTLLPDAALAAALPGIGPVVAYGRPEEHLWHGRNPSHPDFGARMFASQSNAGHLGYWAAGHPALDNLARITLGGAHHALVR